MRFKAAVGLYKKCEQAASDLTGRTRVNTVQMDYIICRGEKAQATKR